MQIPKSFFAFLIVSIAANAFPDYLSGDDSRRLTSRHGRHTSTFYRLPGAQVPPGPQNDTSARLVYDADHPWRPLRRGDIRGVCPGLNTLANHGYLDRSGIVTPGEIIDSVQTAYNMRNDLAVFFTYACFLVDGNMLTNLMSIGSKSSRTGIDPPGAAVGGLNQHYIFEGDASFTRGDKFFGNNAKFNETLFQEGLVEPANKVGSGKLNLESLSLGRHTRYLDSLARNPNFDFTSPRFISAYDETALPLGFWTDKDGNLSLDDARSFYQHGRFPKGFHRREGTYGSSDFYAGIVSIWEKYKTIPGRNQGLGNFVQDKKDPGTGPRSFCYFYHKLIGKTLHRLYPNPEGDLRVALKKNTETLYEALGDPTCKELLLFD